MNEIKEMILADAIRDCIRLNKKIIILEVIVWGLSVFSLTLLTIILVVLYGQRFTL